MEKHRATFSQYVTESVLAIVREFLKGKTVDLSTDPHLNTIPLHLWDNLAGFQFRGSSLHKNNSLKPFPSDSLELIRKGQGQVSPADKVCTLKEAARQILESNS